MTRPQPGHIYRGSIEEARGAVVIDAWDCGCCGQYASGRLSANVRLGRRIMRLQHARPESFTPDDGLPTEPTARVG